MPQTTEQQVIEGAEFDDDLSDEALDRARPMLVTAVCWHCD